jgi:hypothetical protein
MTMMIAKWIVEISCIPLRIALNLEFASAKRNLKGEKEHETNCIRNCEYSVYASTFAATLTFACCLGSKTGRPESIGGIKAPFSG